MKFIPITLLLAALASTQAQAYRSSSRYGGGGGSGEQDRMITVGGGVSSPSVTSALQENPAGLTSNQSGKLLFEGATANDQFNPIGYGGGFFTGNGSVGAGITLQNFNNLANGGAGSLTLLSWGLAADIPNIDMAWGFTGSYTLSQSGNVSGPGTSGAWGVNTGVIFNPHGSSRVGITAYQLQNGVDAVGAGYSLDASPWATLAVDGTYDLGSKTTVIKPALGLHISGFQIASGYGVRAQGSGSSWIPQGWSLGLGVPVGPNFSIQASYNQLAHYYAALTVSL
jgi:hypothetical protein